MKGKRKGKYYVYIVKCKDSTFYTGCTNDLEKRIKTHNEGKGAKYLRGRTPVKLAYVRECRGHKDALRAERDIKKLTREQKEELVKKGPGEQWHPLRHCEARRAEATYNNK
jgi:putative endonuclease